MDITKRKANSSTSRKSSRCSPCGIVVLFPHMVGPAVGGARALGQRRIEEAVGGNNRDPVLPPPRRSAKIVDPTPRRTTSTRLGTVGDGCIQLFRLPDGTMKRPGGRASRPGPGSEALRVNGSTTTTCVYAAWRRWRRTAAMRAPRLEALMRSAGRADVRTSTSKLNRRDLRRGSAPDGQQRSPTPAGLRRYDRGQPHADLKVVGQAGDPGDWSPP